MRSTTWASFSSFWEHERGLSVVLALVVLFVFVLPPLQLIGLLGRLVTDVLASLLIVAGAAGVSRKSAARAVVASIAAVALAVRWTAPFLPSEGMEVAVAFSFVASIATLAVVVLAQVVRRGPVNLHRILGAVAAYLLLGLAWAATYDALALIHPAAFAGTAPSHEARQQWIYFSFVTLTTVGYGDVTPLHPVARSLAMLEALTGQLYPAILLARLVSLEVSSSRQD